MSVELRLREQIWFLEAERQWLRDLLKPPNFLPAIFPLTAKEERLFTALLSRERWARADLVRFLYSGASEGDEPPSKVIDVAVHHIRRKITPLGIEIETINKFGYRITSEMKKRVEAIRVSEQMRENVESAALYRHVVAEDGSFQFANTAI